MKSELSMETELVHSKMVIVKMLNLWSQQMFDINMTTRMMKSGSTSLIAVTMQSERC